MPTATGKFALPYIEVAQAQKEIAHNEALVLIDALLHCAVQTVTDMPPQIDAEADAGKCWLVGADATGAFAGNARAIACWTGSGWRFVRPCEGMTVLNIEGGIRLEFRGDEWLEPVAIEISEEGPVIDIAARTALSLLLEYLRNRGMLRP